jgi:hypothetical protein
MGRGTGGAAPAELERIVGTIPISATIEAQHHGRSREILNVELGNVVGPKHVGKGRASLPTKWPRRVLAVVRARYASSCMGFGAKRPRNGGSVR